MTLPAGVLVVGTGLLGASVGLALRRRGIAVHLDDVDPAAVQVAAGLGAGAPGRPSQPVDLAVVAVPPAATAGVIVDLLADGVARTVTDVASVKARLAAEVLARAGASADRYVGSHPMAGREVSGAAAALDDLFDGRPWVVCPHERSAPDAVAAVEDLARAAGAQPVRMAPAAHDAAVALVSHAPHLLAALVAGRLASAPYEQVRLAGPGVTDVTRVAAGDPAMWTDILGANAAAVRDVLAAVRADLDTALAALDAAAAGRPAPDLPDLLRAGVTGRARLPGKHGGAPTEFAAVRVVVPDAPGRLAALLAAAGDSGANVEDLRIEHSPGQEVGIVELDVRPEQAEALTAALRERGWTVHA